MSIIPKINVGKSKNRERLNLSFDCSTTANIGQIQPSMCREVLPNETIHVSSKSFVRLSPVALPTFGRMSLRHYHCFVSYQDCWDRFNNFLTAQTTQNEGGSAYVPQMSYFRHFADVIMHFSDFSIYERQARQSYRQPVKDVYTLIDFTGMSFTDINTALTSLYTNGLSNHALKPNDTSSTYFGLMPGITPDPNKQGVLVSTNGFAFVDSTKNNVAASTDATHAGVSANSHSALGGYITPVDFDNSDFGFTFGDSNDNTKYICLMRLKPIAKRFRTLVQGLGYSFTPFYDSTQQFNPLKLIAFYKCWFNLFSPIREKQFEQTACYKLQQYLHAQTNIDLTGQSIWFGFIGELMNIGYYLPMDYFSMATATVQQTNSDVQVSLVDSLGVQTITNGIRLNSNASASQLGNVFSTTNSASASNITVNPLFFKLAQQFLTFANKNTVIGRSIRDWLKVHYGIVDNDTYKVNGVEFIGSSRTNIQISEVMSTAETLDANGDGGYLGEYAGKGEGYDETGSMSYNAKEFGCYIVLSVIVPESGYYQGYLKENRQVDRYDFPIPEFDALGYQVLERGELVDSYNSNIVPLVLDPEAYTRTAAFGFVPRYSHHKVGRNIVNGDLSLPSLANAMGRYTLDRQFPVTPEYDTNSYTGYQNGFMPSVVFDKFRLIDMTDEFGNYNRIFHYQGVDVDHFIIHNVFDVNVESPLKSLSNSFDTFSEGDDQAVDVSHS